MMRRGNPGDFADAMEAAALWEWALVVVIVTLMLGLLALAVYEYGSRWVVLWRDPE